jgi:hypothetical protein
MFSDMMGVIATDVGSHDRLLFHDVAEVVLVDADYDSVMWYVVTAGYGRISVQFDGWLLHPCRPGVSPRSALFG